MIVVDNLTKTFTKKAQKGKRKEKIVAVDHINLKINNGEIFGLIGPNGAGKTTQAKLLITYLKNSMKINAMYTHVFDTLLGSRLKEYVLENPQNSVTLDAVLLFATRLKYLEEYVCNQKYSDDIIITDRFIYSVVAYQGGFDSMDSNVLYSLENFTTRIPTPDLVILLGGDPVIFSNRLKGNRDKFEALSLEYHKRVPNDILIS